jgi:hypothetical protein
VDPTFDIEPPHDVRAHLYGWAQRHGGQQELVKILAATSRNKHRDE